jgi:hypothetical protein
VLNIDNLYEICRFKSFTIYLNIHRSYKGGKLAHNKIWQIEIMNPLDGFVTSVRQNSEVKKLQRMN